MSIEIEWLVLADFAQVADNKLYLMGGGWDKLTINTQFPAQHLCSLAVSFRVPWDATNQRHNAQIEILSEDGASIASINGQFEVGRPPGTPVGQSQRSQLAVNIPLTFEKPGTYVVIGRVEGQELARVPFNVVVGPMLAARQPEQPAAG